MPTDVEVLAFRLARIKVLIESFESACAATTEERERFEKLHAEVVAALQAVRPLAP